MSQGITLKIKGIEDVMRISEKYPTVSRKHVNQAIRLSLLAVRNSVVKNGPVGRASRGGMKGKWNIEVKNFEGKLLNVAEAEGGFPYPTAVEYGTKPFWPNTKKGGSLDMWAKSKGIPTFLVARAISRKGIRPQHFFQKSVDENQQKIDRAFETALENIIKDL